MQRRSGVRLLSAAICVALCLPAAAEQPTARYAAAQLRVAEAELERAREAKARGDASLAQRFAAQADFDARLAWSMSESRALRREAAEVLRDARGLMSHP